MRGEGRTLQEQRTANIPCEGHGNGPNVWTQPSRTRTSELGDELEVPTEAISCRFSERFHCLL